MNTENITVNTQSSIRIAGSKVLYFDPFQIAGAPHDADIVFITHSHYDHLDPDSIRKVEKEGTIFIAPASMEKNMAGVAEAASLKLMSPGETSEIDDVTVEAVPAYNKLKPFHPKKNKWNGYVVTMDETRYYVAGDTDAIEELASVSCDVALVPIGGKYTMNAKEAAGLINKICPQTVIPTHYGTIVGKPENADTFAKNVAEGITVETKL